MEDPQIHTPTSSVLKYIVFAAMKLLKIQYKLNKEKKKPTFSYFGAKIMFHILMYPLYALDFQRPNCIIRDSGTPSIARLVAAPMRNE